MATGTPTKRTLPKAQEETPNETPTTVPSNAADASGGSFDANDLAALNERIRTLEAQAAKAAAAQSAASDDPYEAAVINLRSWVEAKRNARPDVDFNTLWRHVGRKNNSGDYVNQIQQKLVPNGTYHFTIAALNADNKPGATA